MHTKGQANLKMATRYFKLFVNRLAYTVQSPRPGVNGKHYYYRPNDNRRLTLETIREHLNGHLTVGLYAALNPATQRSKWVAIDADYGNALDDLLKLQWELRQDGVEVRLRSPAAALISGSLPRNHCWRGIAEFTSITSPVG